ncbi:MAG: universal stress protein, partial [Solirubrobacteraceae bacterium]
TADRHRARAIVLGAKPHSRLHEAIGTVTTELLRSSPVPVITVPLSAEPQVGAPLMQSVAAE